MTAERGRATGLVNLTVTSGGLMLTHLDPASALAVGLLVFTLAMVMMFETTNGFHDAANAVATVIYTKSLKPTQAVVWSGMMNFIGVLIGGIAVAYALVELLPAKVLSPPDGGPAVGMLISLLASALFWNLLTWWFGLPNSSSHCLIGALIGVSVGNALAHARDMGQGVHWHQLQTVLEGLALSPILGFLLAGGLYLLTRKSVHDPHLYEPAGDRPPIWWMRAILIFTCTAVSFAHGTNDGQKSIGMIMLAIIGLFPASYALNLDAGQALAQLPQYMQQAQPLIEKYGDDQKARALQAGKFVQSQGEGVLRFASLDASASIPDTGLGTQSDVARRRSNLRDDIYRMISQLEHVQEAKGADKSVKKEAKDLVKKLGTTVEYAPWWVRILSAVCLGLGTMIGYKRIVTTLGVRWVQIKSHHVGQLLQKPRVPRQLEGPTQMRLQVMQLPQPVDSAPTDPLRFGHEPATPMSHALRLGL